MAAFLNSDGSVALNSDGTPIVLADDADPDECECCNGSSGACVYSFSVTYNCANASFGSITGPGLLCGVSTAYTPRNTWLLSGGTITGTSCTLVYYATGTQACNPGFDPSASCTEPPSAPSLPTSAPTGCCSGYGFGGHGGFGSP